ncbi:MAG: DUF2779 domain-containing protein [Bacteroidia bacterium]|nr:DUF2779 domain-containing protein [Bacteroidia bacterium]
MAQHLLSKSSFIRGVQCEKALYLSRHFPSLRDPLDEKRQAIFSRGHLVGEKARELFPGGKDAFPGSYKKTSEWIRRTRQWMDEGMPVIYEAAFEFNGIMVALDILVREGEMWSGYEVKSSARISPVYLEDAAIQYYVISGSGVPLKEFSLVHIDTSYILEERLDVHRLFTVVPVGKEIASKNEQIAARAAKLISMLQQNLTPDISIGEQCHYPYTCDFFSHCRSHLPKDHTVFDLGGVSMQRVYEWYHTGKILITDLSTDDLDTRDVRIQASCLRSNTVHIEKELLQQFLSGLNFPLIFLDFETMMPAIPVYRGSHPYEQIPFQFSAHVLDAPGATLKHHDFVAPPGEDPRPEFTKELVKVIANAGTILAYNASFERSIMKNCAGRFPESASGLNTAIAKVTDLMEPFKKKWYYHPGMRGSASIKQVLPALAPGFSYQGLNISNGAAAMSRYESLSAAADLFEIQETIEDLKEYCKLDTLAMVKLWETLQQAVMPVSPVQ